MFGGAVLLLGVLFLVHSAKTIDPDVLPRFVLLAAGVGVLLLVFMAGLWSREDTVEIPVAGERAVALWLFYIAAVGASVLVAVNRPEAIFQLGETAVFSVFFVALAWLLFRDTARVETLATALGMLCLALAVVGAVQLARVSLTDGWSLETTYRVLGQSAGRNLYSQTLLLTLPFAVFGAVVGRWAWRAACALGAVLALTLIVVLMTRSVWIGGVAASLATGGLAVLRARKVTERRSTGRERVARAGAAMLLVVAAGLLVSGGTVRSTLVSRFGSILHIHQGTAVPRLFLWSRTTEMVLDHPLLGVGAGNWRIVFPRYGHGDWLMRDVGSMPKRPHNDLLWILAETGTVGLLAYLALIGTILWWTGGAVVAERDRSSAALAAAVFFAEVAYLTVSLFSFPGERIEHSALFVTALAMGLALHHRLKPSSVAVGRGAVRGLSSVALAVVLAVFFAGFVRMRGEVHVKRAYRYLQLAQFQNVVHEIDRAVSPVYTVDRSGFPLRLYRAMALTQLGEQDRAHPDLLRARRESPYNVVVLHRLAQSFAGRGDLAEAVRLWTSALEIHPGYPPAVRGLATVTAGIQGR